MADERQIGSPKILQFGERAGSNRPGSSGDCAQYSEVQCAAMLADVLDGTLAPDDRELFELHLAQCDPCSQLLADARQGAAWLEQLRTPAPEPPAELLERILAQTSGAQTFGAQTFGAQTFGMYSAAATALHSAALDPHNAAAHPQQAIPAMATGYAIPPVEYGTVVPFRLRAAAAFRASAFGQIVLQPRLAMTAAMAFFSVALTMNLTGIRPRALRASDLRPSSLKRDFYSANARVVQYYEGLQVVYELESRVHDVQSVTDSDADGGGGGNLANPAQTNPQAAPQPEGSQPGGKYPNSVQPNGIQPDGGEKQRSRPAPSQGTSRREELLKQGSRTVAEGRTGSGPGDQGQPRAERTVA